MAHIEVDSKLMAAVLLHLHEDSDINIRITVQGKGALRDRVLVHLAEALRKALADNQLHLTPDSETP